jgi:mannose-6-phosphate isomerase-like protein (cupin superfamily)
MQTDETGRIDQLTAASTPIDTGLTVPYEFVDFAKVSGVPCPCGSSQRGMMRPDNQIASIHRVEIKETARVHYHKVLTETYYFLECNGECFMELNGERFPVKPGMAVMIRHAAPGCWTHGDSEFRGAALRCAR